MNTIAFTQKSNIKKYTLIKSTITSVGSSTIYNKNKQIIQQSIGQSSLIGQRKVNSITVQQGFLTNNLYLKIDNSNNTSFVETLDFIISPNPFIDHIKIDFTKKTLHDVYIQIYDVNGKVYASKKYLPAEKIIIPMHRYSIGTYLIQIKSGTNKSTKKILKIE